MLNIVEIGLLMLVAIVIGPFVVGWWIGHPLFAAMVFAALSLTVALGAVGRGEGGGDPAFGVVLSLALSAASAAIGGHLGAKNRQRRQLRR